MKKITAIEIQKLRESRLVRTQQSITAGYLITIPLKDLLADLTKYISNGIARVLEKHDDFESIVSLSESPDYVNNSKIFEAEVVILSRHELNRIQKTLELYENQHPDREEEEENFTS